MRLFISYAHEDLEQVTELVDELRARGHQVWFGEPLKPGADWRTELSKAVAESDGVVYALSPHSAVKDWCHWESAQAVKLGKPVLPVLLQETPNISHTLGEFHVPDFSTGANETFVNNLHHVLAHV